MGLDAFWLYGGPPQDAYNCSKYDDEGWYERGMKRPFLSIYLLVSGITFTVLYILCLMAMVKAKLIFKHSCYMIMFGMGFGDLGSLTVSSYSTSFLCFKGAVYCNYPIFIFIAGAIGLAFWSTSCLFCCLLSLNRFGELADWSFAHTLFQGKRTVVLTCIPFIYGLIVMIWTPPPLFYSPYVAWFFNPYNESGLFYVNWVHSTNNFLIAILSVAAYTAISYKATQKASFSASAFSKVQKLLFVQAFLICSTHVLAAWGYLFMNFIPNFPTNLIIIGHVSWQWSHGSPGLIYLLMNKKIRSTVRGMLCGWRVKPEVSTAVATGGSKKNNMTSAPTDTNNQDTSVSEAQ